MVTKEVIGQDFARRLVDAINHAGLTQSELARRASQHMPKGEGEVSRDRISKYCSGKEVPGPIILAAVARALSIQPSALLPARHTTSRALDASLTSMTDLGDGNVRLVVNQEVPWETAIQIMTILKGSTNGPDTSTGGGRVHSLAANRPTVGQGGKNKPNQRNPQRKAAF